MSDKSRHLERFMPYACDRVGLCLRSVHVAVDDDPRGEQTSGSTLHNSSSEWEMLKLTVSLERSGDLFSLLHPDELGHPPIAVVLAIRCRETFLSHSQCFQHADPRVDKFEQTIILRRNDVRGEISITPHLVRTTHHARRAGLASRRGEWLMKGDPWILQIDETRPRTGNDLEVLRKPFSEVPGILPEDQHNWFALQFDGASPRLFLNEEHTALMSALYDTSKRGKRAAVREALFDQIGAAVWPALLLHAARAWQDSGGDPDPWQANILRLWVRRLWPHEHDLEAGVEQIVQRALHHPAEFSLEISAALQRSDQVRHIKHLLSEVSQ